MTDTTSWTIGQVIITGGVVYSKLPPGSFEDLPPGLTGITSSSTIAEVINSLSREIERLGNQRIGSSIGVGIDGRPVVQTINDLMLIATPQSYTAGISNDYGAIAYNVFRTGSVIANTNYLVKRPGSAITLYIIDAQGATTTATLNIADSSAVATQGALRITDDSDPFITTPALAGATTAIKVQVSPVSLSATTGAPSSYTYYLTTTDGTSIRRSIPFNFYVDIVRDSEPAISNARVTAVSGGTINYISGIARRSGAAYTISVTFSCNLITGFYNNVKTISIASTFFEPTTYLLNSEQVQYAYENPTASMNVSFSAILANGRYALTHQGATTASLWRYDGVVSQSAVDSTIGDFAIDTLTVGPESNLRVLSGADTFPSEFGGAYVSTQSLADNSELQLVGGLFRYPNAVEYPALASESAFRWMTKKIGVGQIVTRGTLTLVGATEDAVMIADAEQLQIYINPDNTVWYSATSAFDPADVSVANGQGAVEYGAYGDVMEGANYVIPITFGSAINITDLYIRVGIRGDSTFAFSGITFGV